jgi:hypothetical protein
MPIPPPLTESIYRACVENGLKASRGGLLAAEMGRRADPMTLRKSPSGSATLIHPACRASNDFT